MRKFYVTFGLGGILGGNYLVAYATDEETLRLRLNADRVPHWCSIFEKVGDVEKWGLKPLEMQYVATSQYNSGPINEAQVEMYTKNETHL